MATPRKNWSKLPDQIIRENWSDKVVAVFVRLQIFLNQRWCRDGLSSQEAGECVLSAQDAMQVTHVQNPRSARDRLLKLPTNTPMGIFEAELVDTGGVRAIKIRWSNFSEFQGYSERPTPTPGSSRAFATLRMPSTRRE
jgi:hypothetical protein